MTKVYLALYHGKGGNWWARFTDWLVRKATRGTYSHCEIAIEYKEYTDRYSCDTSYQCFSSSPRDGGVRCKEDIDLHNGKWDLVQIDVDPAKICTYFARTLGAKYDWWGALGLIFGIKHKRSRFYCSEWCFNAITGSNNGWRFSPNDLAVFFSKGLV